MARERVVFMFWLALALQLMAFLVLMYIIGAVVGWHVVKFIFGWAKQHCNWTEYPNLNGILFIASVVGGFLVISLLVGSIAVASYPRSSNPWEALQVGMGVTGGVIIGSGLIALGIFIAVRLIEAFISWIREK